MTYSINTTNMSTMTGSTFTYNVGGAGTVLTSGTGASSWATISSDPNLLGKTLQVNGDADINGDLKVKGVNLTERLDKIEERLNILRPNSELEEKWENLRALGQAYRELEKEIIEKQEMWAILKK